MVTLLMGLIDRYLDNPINWSQQEEDGRDSIQDPRVLEVLTVVQLGVGWVQVGCLDLIEDKSPQAEATDDDAVH